MRRIMAVLAIVMALIPLGRPAKAHNTSLLAAVSVKGNHVAVRVLDLYGTPVEGAAVTTAVGFVRQDPGKSVALTEGPAGTYGGVIAPPQAGEYEITVEATVAGELFRAPVPARTGADLDLQVPLQAVDQGWFSWQIILYIAAAVVLVGATAVARLRKGQANEDEQ